MNTGALINKKDLRDIPASEFQPIVSILPSEYLTDISMFPVLNQGAIGSCVGHAHSLVHAYYEFKESGNTKNFSPRWLYALSKRIDGYIGEGTYPRVTADIMTKNGCTDLLDNNTSLTHSNYISFEDTPEMQQDAVIYKTKGYAFVNPDKVSMKQALINNKLVTVTLSVGNWGEEYVQAGVGGWHRVTIYGYKDIGNDTIFFFRNSWGDWGDNGNGKFKFSDHKGKIQDLMVFTDIPNMIKEIKRYKYFTNEEVKGLKPELITMLDKARELAGVPFVLTSTLRSPEVNDDVGGVQNSAHLSGLAVDIRVRNSNERFRILKALIEVGFNRIGVAKTFCHADIDKSKPANVSWLY